MAFDTRVIRSLASPTLEDVPSDFTLPSRHFMVLLIIDDRAVADERFIAFARRMIAQGAVFLCVWAPDSLRVRDLFSAVISEYEETDDRYLMSAGREQRFEQMLWYFLYATRPAPDFCDSCEARVVVTVGAPHLHSAVHRYLAEPHTETLDRIATQDLFAEGDALPGGDAGLWIPDDLDD